MTKPICYLICVFNDQQGLETTLQSVFRDDPLADILIIDDGSTPPMILPPIPEGFAVALIPLPRNEGLIGALNYGLQHILNQNYRYIARLDSGDTVNPGRLRLQLDYMESHRDVGMVGTQLRAFDKYDNRTLFHFNNPVGTIKVSHTLKIKNCIAHPSVMVRTDVYRVAGFYDPAFVHAEDYEMWRRIDKRFKVDNLPDILVNKEISPYQITAINRRKSTLSKFKAQIKYFNALDLWCWIGVSRTVISLLIPRRFLLFVRSRLSMAS